MTPTAMAAEYLQATRGWQWRSADGLTLRGRQWQQDGGELLHFIHGNGFCAGTYWPFLRELRGAGSAILHDLQGHGASDAGTRYIGPTRTAERALLTLAQHPLDDGRPCTGIAHSFGGYITLLMAVREPRRFARLILLDPIFIPPAMLWGMRLWRGLNPLVKRALQRRSEWPDLDAARAQLRGRGIFRGLPDAALECYVQHALRPQTDGRVTLCCPPWMEAAIFATPPLNTWRAITRLQVPVTIFYGAESYPFMAPAMHRAARKNPLIEIKALPGGHCFMLEAPQATAQEVLGVLRRA